MNKNSALNAAYRANGYIRDFGYISAARVPLASSLGFEKYYRSKEEAEAALLGIRFFRTIIARPSFMYGPGRVLSWPVSLGYNVATWFAGGLFPRALHVDTVAKSMLDAMCTEDRHNRVLEVNDMKYISK